MLHICVICLKSCASPPELDKHFRFVHPTFCIRCAKAHKSRNLCLNHQRSCEKKWRKELTAEEEEFVRKARASYEKKDQKIEEKQRKIQPIEKVELVDIDVEMDQNQTDLIKVESYKHLNKDMKSPDQLDDNNELVSVEASKIEYKPRINIFKKDPLHVKPTEICIDSERINSVTSQKTLDKLSEEIYMFDDGTMKSHGRKLKLEDAPKKCQIRCKRCLKIFVGFEGLKCHYQSRHRHHCLYCGRYYEKRRYPTIGYAQLAAHTQTCSVRKKNTLAMVGTFDKVKCTDCGIHFKNRLYYECHHTPKICRICCVVFPLECKLIAHLKEHYTPLIEKLIRFKEVPDLITSQDQRHTTINCGGDLCSSSNSFGLDFDSFLAHVTFNHETPMEKKYIFASLSHFCVICKRAFDFVSQRTKHTLQAHPLHCPACFRALASPAAVTIHYARTHKHGMNDILYDTTLFPSIAQKVAESVLGSDTKAKIGYSRRRNAPPATIVKEESPTTPTWDVNVQQSTDYVQPSIDYVPDEGLKTTLDPTTHSTQHDSSNSKVRSKTSLGSKAVKIHACYDSNHMNVTLNNMPSVQISEESMIETIVKSEAMIEDFDDSQDEMVEPIVKDEYVDDIQANSIEAFVEDLNASCHGESHTEVDPLAV